MVQPESRCARRRDLSSAWYGRTGAAAERASPLLTSASRSMTRAVPSRPPPSCCRSGRPRLSTNRWSTSQMQTRKRRDQVWRAIVVFHSWRRRRCCHGSRCCCAIRLTGGGAMAVRERSLGCGEAPRGTRGWAGARRREGEEGHRHHGCSGGGRRLRGRGGGTARDADERVGAARMREVRRQGVGIGRVWACKFWAQKNSVFGLPVTRFVESRH
jgi:hypothetical protein